MACVRKEGKTITSTQKEYEEEAYLYCVPSFFGPGTQ